VSATDATPVGDAPEPSIEPATTDMGASRTRWIGWALLGVVGLVAVGAIALRVTERGRFALPYSTVSAGPDGTRALMAVLREQGIDAVPWTEDVGRLPPGGALVILGGCDHVGTRPMSRPERERLDQWIEAGGVFIVAGAAGYVNEELGATLHMRSLTQCLDDPGLVSLARAAEEASDDDSAPVLPPPTPPPGVEPDPDADLDKPEFLLPDPDATLDALDGTIALPEPIWGIPALPPLAGMPLLGMRNGGAIELAPGADARVLASTGGKLGVVEIRRGEGRVIVIASASLFQNRDLSEHGGALLMTRLIRYYLPDSLPAARRVVRFDEYHVGAGDRRSMARYFTQVGVVPLILQILFGVGLLLILRSRRFGAVREPLRAPVSSTSAFVGGLAGLFSASKDRKGALSILARAALRSIGEAHRVAGEDVDVLTKGLEDRGRKDAAESVREVVRIGERPMSSKGDLARASRALDEAVEHATRRDGDVPTPGAKSASVPRPAP
jgi:hypothetical protein